jgi:hypothetical protein
MPPLGRILWRMRPDPLHKLLSKPPQFRRCQSPLTLQLQDLPSYRQCRLLYCSRAGSFMWLVVYDVSYMMYCTVSVGRVVFPSLNHELIMVQHVIVPHERLYP